MRPIIFFIIFCLPCLIIFQECRKKDCPDPKDPNANTDTVSTTVVFKPAAEGKDSYVSSINPDHNYEPNFGIMHAMAGTWSGTPGKTRAYIQFDYSGIPAGAEIKSAMLKLYADTTYTSITGPPKGHTSLTGPNDIYVKRVISPWDENTITWNNQPSSDDVDRLSLPESTSRSQTYLIDITHFVKDEFLNPLSYHGVMIQLQTEVEYRAVAFCSGDHMYQALHPELEITYRK